MRLSALSIVWLVQVSAPASSPWASLSNNTINFTAPYFWMSLSLNISMTIAICARLLFYRRRITRVLGPNHGTQYTSVAAMIVESSFIYSAFSLLFLIPFALNNPIQNAFIQLMGEIQVSIAVSIMTYIINTFIFRLLLPFLSLIVWRMVLRGSTELHRPSLEQKRCRAQPQEFGFRLNSQVLRMIMTGHGRRIMLKQRFHEKLQIMRWESFKYKYPILDSKKTVDSCRFFICNLSVYLHQNCILLIPCPTYPLWRHFTVLP